MTTSLPSFPPPLETELFLLDDELTREYKEASTIAPDLVAAESQVDSFIAASDGDWKEAARRIARYWKVRKEVFEEDRWLLPLNATGFGALDAQDVEIWRSGYFVPMRMEGGGLFFLVDRSRLPRAPGLAEARIMFYWNFIEGPKAVCPKVHVISSAHCPPPSQDVGVVIRRIAQALPIKKLLPSRAILAQTYEPTKQDLLDFLGFQAEQIIRYKTGNECTRVAAQSVGQLIQQFQSLGIQPSSLPPSLGGTYDYKPFDDFLRMRLSIEGPMSASLLAHGWNNLYPSPPLLMLNKCNDDNNNNNNDSFLHLAKFSRLNQPNSVETFSRSLPPVLLPRKDDVPAVYLDRQAATATPSPPATTNTFISTPTVTRQGISVRPDRPKYSYERQNERLADLRKQHEKLQAENNQLRAEQKQYESSLARARYIAAVATANEQSHNTGVHHHADK
eukprot:scaffold982_cov169-Amphora_coffeaeformis.AAC.2